MFRPTTPSKFVVICLVIIYRDTGVMSPDGKLEILGRSSDSIRFKIDRKVVWPAPIEEALVTHPCIKEMKVSNNTLLSGFM